mmetsp:Transcript_6492/g.12866  ORF Transcript_6492/g.12866 Transcript_6492/m.12866 type:complete len:286 (+) Transcript_6492:969-1826(+)
MPHDAHHRRSRRQRRILLLLLRPIHTPISISISICIQYRRLPQRPPLPFQKTALLPLHFQRLDPQFQRYILHHLRIDCIRVLIGRCVGYGFAKGAESADDGSFADAEEEGEINEGEGRGGEADCGGCGGRDADGAAVSSVVVLASVGIAFVVVVVVVAVEVVVVVAVSLVVSLSLIGIILIGMRGVPRIVLSSLIVISLIIVVSIMVIVSPASPVASRIPLRISYPGVSEVIHHVIGHTLPCVAESLFHIQFALLGMSFEDLFYGIGVVASVRLVATSSLAVIRI